MINICDSFYLANRENGKEHLHFVISNPDKNGYVLLVNISTLNEYESDKSCVLNSTDHERIKHPSIIKYAKAHSCKKEYLDSQYNHGLLIKEKPISLDVLKKIQDGAKKSDALSNKYKNFFDYF